jgi:hypothetical protein
MQKLKKTLIKVIKRQTTPKIKKKAVNKSRMPAP